MILHTDNMIIDLFQVEAVYKLATNDYGIELYSHGRAHTLLYKTKETRDKVYDNILKFLVNNQHNFMVDGETGELLP